MFERETDGTFEQQPLIEDVVIEIPTHDLLTNVVNPKITPIIEPIIEDAPVIEDYTPINQEYVAPTSEQSLLDQILQQTTVEPAPVYTQVIGGSTITAPVPISPITSAPTQALNGTTTLDEIIETITNGGNAIACTMDAKVCPDGSTVGRTAPNCEFAPCPANETPTTQTPTTQTPTTQTPTTQAPTMPLMQWLKDHKGVALIGAGLILLLIFSGGGSRVVRVIRES